MASNLASVIDRDAPNAAAVSRRKFLERYAETGTMCCFAHTTVPSAGLVRRLGAGLLAWGFEGARVEAGEENGAWRRSFLA